jgi:hypothetical protein
MGFTDADGKSASSGADSVDSDDDSEVGTAGEGAELNVDSGSGKAVLVVEDNFESYSDKAGTQSAFQTGTKYFKEDIRIVAQQ